MHNKSAEQLEKEIANSKDTRKRVLLRNDLTEKLIFTDRKKAVQQNEICLKEAQEIKDQKLITLFKFKKNAGLVFNSKFKEAVKGFKALIPAAKVHNPEQVARIYRMLMFCTNNEQKKFEYLLEALSFARANKQKFLIGDILEDLAMLNERLNYPIEDSEKYFLKALEIFESADGEPNHLISTYVNVANFYLDNNEKEKAIFYKEKIGQITKQDAISNYVIYRCKAVELRILFYEEKYKEAIKLANSFINEMPKDYDLQTYATIHFSTAQSKIKEKRFSEAKEHLNIALETSANKNRTKKIIKEHLIEIALEENDFKTAYNLRTEIFDSQSAFVEAKQTQTIAEMKTKFETERKERENLELKLIALRAQMNPHFIFNSLNSIQNYVTKNKKEETIKYISKFSRLMRQTLSNSEDKNIFLEEELEFLENYLSLEKLRFKNVFDYQIILDENVDATFTKIPSMIVQPYVENAIIHGMENKKEGGSIKIHFRESDCGSLILCSVSDNGSGLGQEKNINKKHKSLGTKITNDRINALANGKKISAKYIDLKSKKLTGAQVEIEIPIV